MSILWGSKVNGTRFFLLVIFLSYFCFSASALIVSVETYDPLPARAGEFANIYISVQNNSRADTKPISLTFVPKDSIKLSPGESPDKNIGIISGNRAVSVKYKVIIDEYAVDGENEFEVIAYEGVEHPQRYKLSIDVDNSLPNIQIGSVDSDPKKILPGTNDVKLDLKLVNIGDSAAENVKVTLVVPSGFELSNSFSNIVFVGNIDADSSAEASFFVNIPEDLKPGKYNAELLVEYTKSGKGGNNFLSKSLPFEIFVWRVPKFELVSIETNPEELVAGQRNVNLKIRLRNVGEADAEVVRFKVFEKTELPFEFDSQSAYVAPKLKPGEEAEVNLVFRVKDDAVAQKYLLPGEVKSFFEDSVRVDEVVVPISVVSGKPESPNFFVVLVGSLIVLLVVVIVYLRSWLKAKSLKN